LQVSAVVLSSRHCDATSVEAISSQVPAGKAFRRANADLWEALIFHGGRGAGGEAPQREVASDRAAHVEGLQLGRSCCFTQVADFGAVAEGYE